MSKQAELEAKQRAIANRPPSAREEAEQKYARRKGETAAEYRARLFDARMSKPIW